MSGAKDFTAEELEAWDEQRLLLHGWVCRNTADKVPAAYAWSALVEQVSAVRALLIAYGADAAVLDGQMAGANEKTRREFGEFLKGELQ